MLNGNLPCEIAIDEEGHYKTLRAFPFDNDGIDFQIEDEKWNEDKGIGVIFKSNQICIRSSSIFTI